MKYILLVGLLLSPLTTFANSANDQQLLFKAKQTNSVVQINASNKSPGELNRFLAQAKTMGVKVQVINNGNIGEVNRNNMIINHHGASQIMTPSNSNSAKSHLQKMRDKAENRRNRYKKNN